MELPIDKQRREERERYKQQWLRESSHCCRWYCQREEDEEGNACVGRGVDVELAWLQAKNVKVL